MNEHLVKEWQRCVRPGDTIICLGDVGHPNAWRDRRLVLDIRSCPGTRFLVLGNHDGDRDALREAGFTTQRTLALCATDPPLALSHVPLWSVPHGTINVHGHIHGGHEPTPAIRVLRVARTLADMKEQQTVTPALIDEAAGRAHATSEPLE